MARNFNNPFLSKSGEDRLSALGYPKSIEFDFLGPFKPQDQQKRATCNSPRDENLFAFLVAAGRLLAFDDSSRVKVVAVIQRPGKNPWSKYFM